MKTQALAAALFVFVLTLTLTSGASAGDSPDRPALTDYMLNCQGCHSPDGSGVSGKVPSMLGQAGKFLHVEGGRDFLVRVPGSANSALNSRELAELLNWMLVSFSPKEMPEGFVPYTEIEVERLRQQPLVEVEAVRAMLAQDIELLGMGRP